MGVPTQICGISGTLIIWALASGFKKKKSEKHTITVRTNARIAKTGDFQPLCLISDRNTLNIQILPDLSYGAKQAVLPIMASSKQMVFNKG